MLDAPGFYLVENTSNPINGMQDEDVARLIRKVIVEPAHTLGAAVFGETYNLGQPSVNKMLDGGRCTDMPNQGNGGDNFPGFPGKLHEMITAGNVSGLEALLTQTVDVLASWSGGAVRIEPYVYGDKALDGLHAATIAVVAGAYYVVRMGPNCQSPYPSYAPPAPGDEWPGGCYGKWTGANAVAQTLAVIHTKTPALHPGTPRRALRVTQVKQHSCFVIVSFLE